MEFLLDKDQFPILNAKKNNFIDPCIVSKGESKNNSQIINQPSNDAIRKIASMKLIYMLLINRIISNDQAIHYARIVDSYSKPATCPPTEVGYYLKQWADTGTLFGV